MTDPDRIKETKQITILNDGRQFLVKIPTDFGKHLKLTKGDKAECTLLYPKSENEKAILEIKIVKDYERRSE